MQIELARGLYMNEASLVRTPDFSSMRDRLTQFASALSVEARTLLGKNESRRH